MALPLAVLVLAAVSPAAVAHATKTAQAPTIDGRLDDPAWASAAPTDSFVQHYPVGGAAPSERTTMRVVYDEEALYFGFDCEQVHSPIVERLTRRDRDSESEWISVRIDPKNEAKVAFSFAVNATGVLADGLITEPATWNFEWDENWEASTSRTPHGWSAEFRIPFRVLRFDPRDVEGGWSLQAARYVTQQQETDLWPHLPRDAANPLSHFGKLEGLGGINAGGAFELRPFITGRARRLDATDQTSATGYDARATAGIDIKWHLAPDLTLDAAVLPDFGQVEADQVILNLTNYETFLPEKRPLFLEGADVFTFPMQIFYSRRIGIAPTAPTLQSDNAEKLVNLPEPAAIYGATKVVGRIARSWTVGALASVTGRNEVAIEGATARTNRLLAPLSTQTVFRLKRDWAGSGHVGLMGTGVTTFESAGGTPAVCPSGMAPAAGTNCFRDSYVAGADALWRSPSGDYIANGAVIGSLVRGGPGVDQVVEQLDGTKITSGSRAPGGWLRAAKEGGNVLASVSYWGAGRTLDYNALGYMPRQNLHEMKASVGYRTLNPGKLTIETLSSFDVTQRRSLAGLDLGQLYALSTSLRFLSFWRVGLAAEAAPRRFDDREVGNGVALERRGYLGGRLEIDSDPKRTVVASVVSQVQVADGGAQMVSAQGSLTLLPLPQLEIALEPQVVWASGEFRYARQMTPTAPMMPVAEPIFGRLRATSVGAILRAGYTFAPHVSLQAYAQAYLAAGHFSELRAIAAVPGQSVSTDALAAAPPLPTAPATSPDFEQAALNVNVVFRWEYRLGSTLFLVYSRSQMPDILLFTPPAMLQPQALGRRAAADVIMFKLTYWWAG